VAGRQFHDKQISMSHGAGGQATRRLIEGLFAPALSNPLLDALGDAAVIENGANGPALAVTTDGFVVKPLVFPGGSIGELAVNGTVNDLAVSGATPLGLTASFILEAGLDAEVLRREVAAMADAARRAGVAIIAGDTKVVEHGKADGLYIATTGLGRVHPAARLEPARVVPGDKVLLSGPIGDHGITIMIARAELDLEAAELRSDTRSLLPFTAALLDVAGDGIKWMRDATRGGVATVLNELAEDAVVGVIVDEQAVPLRDVVRGACELLGLDPLHVANEGQFVAVVAPEAADAALGAVQALLGGEEAAIIGEVAAAPAGRVLGKAPYGSTRVIDVLVGDPLPRIC
jgi:hydrogenase expression/formation protein HypE